MKLLLVDDDQDLREALVEHFTDVGFQVCTAENGQSALEFLKTNSVDVILSDVQMPVMNGMDFLTQVKTVLGDNPPVYIYTGFSNYSKIDFLNKGAKGFFEKPINLDQFLETIQKDIPECSSF